MKSKPVKRRQGRQGATALAPAERDQALQRGLALLQAGQPQQAAQMFNAVLKILPGDADALHLNGIAQVNMGQARAARLSIRKALKQAPDNAGYWISLASVEESLGNAGATEEAYDKALTLQPANAEAWNNYGAFLLPQGRVAEAEKAYGRAVRLAPGYLQAVYNLAVLLLNTGRPDQAMPHFEAGLRLHPDHPEFLINMGVALQRLRRFDEARAAQERLLALMPNNPGALTNLSSIHYDAGDLAAAETFGRKAVAAAPDLAPAWNNLGNALAAQEKFGEAEQAKKRAWELAPDHVEIVGNLANLMEDTGRLTEAEVLYERAVELEPGNPRHRFQLAICHLIRGRLAEAWPLYEAGFACGERRPDRTRTHPAIRWTGEALDRRCLHIWPEQGIGDEIGAAALFEEVRALSGPGRIVVECDARLVTALQRSFPDMDVMAEGDFPEGEADFQIPMASLRGLFWTDVAGIRAKQGFIRPDPDRLADCRARLAALGDKPKVGIAWGSGLVTARRKGSLSALDQWREVLAVEGVAFVNLQYGDREAELAAAEAAFGRPIHRWPDLDLKDDIDSALALTAAVDLVIDMGTSVGQMAAAVGTPCWTLLRRNSWPLMGTDRLPPYSCVTVYPRRHDQDWVEILDGVAGDLRAWAARPS